MDYSMIGIILTVVIGIPGIIWFILWYQDQKREERKGKLKNIIKAGINEFTSYKELYDFLIRYHSDDLKRLKNKYSLIGQAYFKKTLGDKIMFKEDNNLYEFPLIYKKNWLKSSNKKFWLELGELRDDCSNDLLLLSKDFLKKRFNISNFVEFNEECGKRVWGQTTFDLYKIKGILTIFCCKSNYLNFVSTYEVIQKELYYNYIYGEEFVLRKKIGFNNLEDYSWRPAKIGINVFTIMKRKDGGYSTFIHKRRSNQIEYPGLYHVIPAGTFQPVSEHSVKKQYSFGYTIFREFLEELFDLEEADKKYRLSDPLKIFSLPVEHPIDSTKPQIYPGKLLLGEKLHFAQFKTEKYELIPTGFLIDITSFKPEITFILFIKDETIHEVLQEYIRGCWEADIAEYDLTGNKYAGNFFDFLSNHLTVNEFLPAGAVAVSEGVKWYMENLRKV